MFPEARLVLTKRSPDSWQRSMRETLVKVKEVVEEEMVEDEVVEEEVVEDEVLEEEMPHI